MAYYALQALQMGKTAKCKRPASAGAIAKFHPCYDERAHKRYGRVHIPVAPKCNIACGFCDRKVSQYYHTSRPGVAGKIVKPSQAIKYVRDAVAREPATRVIGIAGPGDPLYNEETFETFRLLQKEFPGQSLCVCTNGLLLPERLGDLLDAGVRSITVTVNAVDPAIGAKINSRIRYKGRLVRGVDAAKLLHKNQLDGIKKAVDSGALVKVNTILIPEINMGHIPAIARKMKSLGVPIMNIMPLIPCGRFKRMQRPTCEQLQAARDEAEKFIPQFRACRQCRADACGVPGKGDAAGKKAGGHPRGVNQMPAQDLGF